MNEDRRFDLRRGLALELCEDPVADDGASVRVRVSDTYGVLAPIQPMEPPTDRTPAQALEEAARYEAPSVGSAHWLPSHRNQAAHIRAILYDFDRDPATTPEIVRRTLEAVLEKALSRGVECIVLPYDFGLAHGGIHVESWHGVLADTLRSVEERAEGLVDLTVRLEIPSGVDAAAVAEALAGRLRTLH